MQHFPQYTNWLDVRITDYYLLEELLVKIDLEIARCVQLFINGKRVEKLEEFKAKVQQVFRVKEEELSRVLRDYTALVCWGEARHSYDKCYMFSKSWNVFSQGGSESERSASFTVAKLFNPEQFLPKLVTLFDRKWVQGYGGEPWKVIAEAGVMYWTKGKKVFLDHVVDLSHHNGLFLNKSEAALFMYSQKHYLLILNLKRNRSLLELGKTNGLLWVSEEVQKILQRAQGMQLVDIALTWQKIEMTSPRVIEWGELQIRLPRSIRMDRNDMTLDEMESETIKDIKAWKVQYDAVQKLLEGSDE